MAAEYLERMGARIRERREELGLPRDEVAKQMPGKTNGNAIYRWERGDHRPHDDTLEALAAVLDCDVSYFLAAEPATDTGDLMGALGDKSAGQLDRLERMLADNNAMLGRVLEILSPEDPAGDTAEELTEAALADLADGDAELGLRNDAESGAKPAAPRPRAPRRRRAA